MYQRPTMPTLVFTDSAGEPIPYGTRWSTVAAPERTYSLTRHPERFEPLIEVSRSLVAYLEATYDVDVHIEEGLPDAVPDRIRRYEHGQVRIARTTTLRPRNERCAPLVIAETTFPSVVVAMGAAGLESAPSCGCDACDEAIEVSAEELENLVFAVAHGRYQERYSWAEGIETSMAGEWGARTAHTPRRAAVKADLDELRSSQRERHGERWLPWPPRRDDAVVAEPVTPRLGLETVVEDAIERIKRHLRSA